MMISELLQSLPLSDTYVWGSQVSESTDQYSDVDYVALARSEKCFDEIARKLKKSQFVSCLETHHEISGRMNCKFRCANKRIDLRVYVGGSIKSRIEAELQSRFPSNYICTLCVSLLHANQLPGFEDTFDLKNSIVQNIANRDFERQLSDHCEIRPTIIIERLISKNEILAAREAQWTVAKDCVTIVAALNRTLPYMRKKGFSYYNGKMKKIPSWLLNDIQEVFSADIQQGHRRYRFLLERFALWLRNDGWKIESSELQRRATSSLPIM